MSQTPDPNPLDTREGFSKAQASDLMAGGLFIISGLCLVALLIDIGSPDNTRRIITLFIALANLVAGLFFRRRARRLPQHPFGHCPACGYDLRQTPDRCPECGLEHANWAKPESHAHISRHLNRYICACIVVALTCAILLNYVASPMAKLLLGSMWILCGTSAIILFLAAPRRANK